MPKQLNVSLLGHTTILLDDAPVTTLYSRTAEALLFYLMCHDRPLTRPFLADFFWDERSPQRAATNLRTVLSMLRKALGEFLIITRENVAFNHAADYYLDVAEFERQWSQLEPVIQSPLPLTDEVATQLQAALDLYHGDFLEGFYLSESRGFEEWTLLTQERLRRQSGTGLRRLVTYYLENGEYQTGLQYAERLLTADPYQESIHRQMMWLLVRNGQRNAALQQYQACRQLLDEELGVEPSSATTAVYEQIQALPFPPPCRLPVQPTLFIGRETELAEVIHQLSRSECRLLSILGPGGIGKTRLAVEAAHRLGRQRPGQFLDGVYFVPLAAIGSAAYLSLALAESLDFTFQGAAEPAQQLINYLRQKELLLLLDNFEHLLTDDRESLNLLAQILTDAPQVKLLVTTRQRLNLYEEWLFDLAGLAYPEEAAVTDPDQYSAVQLFLQNARRLQRTFTPAAEDWPAIIRLCQLLEGMPLGLELASAWVRQLSCTDIVAQVEQSPETLATSYHNVPARHRSLTAVFAHSWDLLTTSEQAIFRRLSLLRGGFTSAAATAVAGADGQALAALVEKSLLRYDPDSGRYDMHSLLRQYAAEKLRQDLNEEEQVVAEHGRFFASLLAQKEAALNSAQEQRVLEELHADLPDLRAAWSWATAVAPTDAAPLAGMVYSLAYLYDVQGLYQEGVNLFQTTAQYLAPFSEAPVARQHGRALTWLGRFLYHMGQYEEARHTLEKGITLLRALSAQEELALALTYLGELARFENNFSLAHQYQAESLALARTTHSNLLQTLALLHLGKIHIAQGQYEQARPIYQEGLAICRETGSPRQIALFEDNLGTIALELGEYESARQKFEAGHKLRQALDDKWGLAASLNNLGVLASATGDHSKAVEKYRLAEAAFRHIGHQWGVAQALTNLGNVLSDLGEYEAATKSLRRALRLWQESGSQIGESDALYYLGQVAFYSRAYEEAKSFYEKSLALSTEIGDDRQTAVVWRDLGVVLTHLDDLPAGGQYLRQSLALAVEQEIIPDVLYALSGWAEWRAQQGDTAVAVQLLALVAAHPAARQQEKEEAQQQMAALSAAVPKTAFRAAQKKGEKMAVDTAVAEILAGTVRRA